MTLLAAQAWLSASHRGSSPPRLPSPLPSGKTSILAPARSSGRTTVATATGTSARSAWERRSNRLISDTARRLPGLLRQVGHPGIVDRAGRATLKGLDEDLDGPAAHQAHLPGHVG